MTSMRDDEATPALPERWAAYPPTERDVEDLVRLLRRHERQARGWPGADSETVGAEVTGLGAASRSHVIVRDQEGMARGWVSCHDRAAGRVLVGVTADPDLDDELAELVAAFCFDQAERFGAGIARERSLDVTQLDSGAFQDDPRQRRWLTEAGYEQVRDWWQMSRAVTPEQATS
nr:GNAT family N-acetyltransferase [Actinomycetota bacterium]